MSDYPEATKRKKPYAPPAIREEEVFERAALQGGTKTAGGCKHPVES